MEDLRGKLTLFTDCNGDKIFTNHRLEGEINGQKGIFTIKKDGFNALVMEGFEYRSRYKQHGFLKFNAKHLKIIGTK